MVQPSWVAGRLRPEPLLSRFFYNTFVKRSSSYMATVMVTATTVGICYEYSMEWIWRTANKGKLWNDIKMNYKEEEE